MNEKLRSLTPNLAFVLEDRALIEAAVDQCPEVHTHLRLWQLMLPLPTRIAQTRAGRWIRFPESYRSMAWLLGQEGESAGSLIAKGAERSMDDFDELVAWTTNTAFRADNSVGHMPMSDHCALRESKVSGALTSREALGEAKTALTLQRAHLKHYGTLLPMPLPLMVHRFDGALVERVSATVRAQLTPKAFGRVETSLR